MKRRPAEDLSSLPSYGFGPRMTMWWGGIGFMLIETVAFALAAGTYLYLAVISPQWPPDGATRPGLLWPSLLLLVLAVSLVPNHWVLNRTRNRDLRAVRRGLIVMTALAPVPVVLRALEFTTLNVRWDQNAYGSVVWMILGLHTLHLVTDIADSAVLTALMFTRHAHGKRFSDVEDNAVYWDFVVLSWVPIYALLYWFPRLPAP